MPILATAAKGSVNIMLEANNGEQLLLATTAVQATITGLTAPSGSTGMRVHIKLSNWTTSGTLTITGTGNPASTETVNVPAPTSQMIQSSQLANFEYVSVNAYTALTNITTTGLTSGVITVWGIYAGKYQLPSVLKGKRLPKTYSPNEHNTLIERDKKILQLVNNTTIDEIKQDVYGDLSLWWCYLSMGAPITTTTLPGTPTSLLPAASITSSMTLTTQPTAPGMKLILTVTLFSIAGTLTITGTVNGVAGVTETIAIGANGTYYSTNVYSNVSSIANATTAGTLAITGVYGWQYTFGSGANQYTAAVEWFDGVGSWVFPFVFATDSEFDIKAQTEATLTMKGKAQDMLAIGDRTTASLVGTNRILAIGPNLNDTPIVGWQTLIYMDAITGTPLTTPYNDLEELKISMKIPQEDHFTFNNSQNFSRAYAVKRECKAEATIDFINMLQWEQFRMNLKQYLAFQFLGQYIGTSGGSPLYKSWTWTLPVRSDGTFDVTSDPTKGSVSAKANWQCEYDPVLGGSYRLVMISQMPPVYTV